MSKQNRFPTGSLVDFTGNSLEQGFVTNPCKAIFFRSSEVAKDVSFLLCPQNNILNLIAVNDTEIKLSGDQESDNHMARVDECLRVSRLLEFHYYKKQDAGGQVNYDS